jgi:CRISPR system Cascade subunit CasC
MTTFIQLHLLTVVAPANLNRDDTGAPKSAMIGGEPRLRLSSQSLKRAWRTSEIFETQLAGRLGKRTQRFGDTIFAQLCETGLDEKKALAVTRRVILAFGKPKKESDKDKTHTEQLAFLSAQEKQAALDLAARLAKDEDIDDKKIPSEILKGADTAVDIAMFGRMFADHPEFNREAAVQVAHAFTTHRVEIEDDFYTAVDDLNTRREDVGAGFVGEAGFGAGVFYAYLCIDTDLLTANLGGDAELARAGVKALIEAAAKVAPNGKRASFGSHVRASYVLAERGRDQPRTLAAAFNKPLEAGEGVDVLADSIGALRSLRAGFARAYGEELDHAEMSVLAPETQTLAGLASFAVSGWSA